MVEAAMVFPLIILAVMAALYILISLYEMSVVQSHMHLFLRQESGTITETSHSRGYAAEYLPEDKYGRRGWNSKIITYDGLGFGYKRLSGTYERAWGGRGLLGVIFKEQSGDVYMIDEVKEIRIIDLTEYNRNES